jgi:Flp pilus assembly protein TadD
MGQVLFLDDSKEEAARCFQKAIELDGYSAETLNSIGVILAERGRTDDAVNALKKAHAYMPDHPAVLDNMRRLTGQPSA